MSNWLEVRIPISPRADYFNRVRLIAQSIRSLGGRYADVAIRVSVGADQEPEDLRALLPWSDALGVTWRWVDRNEFRAWAKTSHPYIATMMERFCPPFDAENILMLDADVLVMRSFDELMSRLECRPAVAGVMAHVTPFGAHHVAVWRHLFQIMGSETPSFDYQLSGWGVMTNDPAMKMGPAYFNTGVILAPSRLLEQLYQPYMDALALLRGVIDSYFFEQIALTLALYKTQIPLDVLPARYNFPNQAGIDAFKPDELADICFLHFLREDVINRARDFNSLVAMQAFAARRDLVGSNEALRRRVGELLPSMGADQPAPSRAQRKVFVDCGSNLCKVLEDRIHRGSDDEFFAFEPQTELAHIASEVGARHPEVKLHFEPKAVWVRDEKLNFFLATCWGPNHRGGSTLMNGHTNNAAAVDYARPITVQAFDFSTWLKNNFSQDDHVVVKMDIEGAEYPVLEKMIADGSIDLVDELIVEFHQYMNETISKERHDLLVGELNKRVKLENWH